MAKGNSSKTADGSALDFEAQLWAAADKMRGHMDASEYCFRTFASAEGKGGGEFYTPQCVVQVLVAMLEPYKGQVFDPCCGSGGMFVSSEKFVEEHGGRLATSRFTGRNLTTPLGNWRGLKSLIPTSGAIHSVMLQATSRTHSGQLSVLCK